MNNIITIQDEYNGSKTMQFKQSKCSHFYMRQLINGKPITNWQRGVKSHIKATIGFYFKGTLIK